jgi:hypothetical protein
VLVLYKENNNKEGGLWQEGYRGTVALMLGGTSLGTNLSMD